MGYRLPGERPESSSCLIIGLGDDIWLWIWCYGSLCVLIVSMWCETILLIPLEFMSL